MTKRCALREVVALEERFAEIVGAGHALAVSSGTVALEVALRACEVGPGDEVILSPYDWGAAAGAVLRLGAIPVFGDIEHETYVLDASTVAAALGPRTRAVVATHIFGHPADVDAIAAIVKPRAVRLIEDAAQALGARLRGRPVGALGDVGCFSMGAGKLASAGEAGLLVTNSEALYDAALVWSQHPTRQISLLGRVGPLRDLVPNGRINPLAVPVALQELNDLDQRLSARRERCEQLLEELARVRGIRPPLTSRDVSHAWHRMSPSFAPGELAGESRDALVERLACDGVPIIPGFIQRPLHLQGVFQERTYGAAGWPWRWAGSTRNYSVGDCPEAERRCAEHELGLAGEWHAMTSQRFADIVVTLRRSAAAATAAAR